MTCNYFGRQQSRCVKALTALALASGWDESQQRWHSTLVDKHFSNLRSLKRRMSKPNKRGALRLRDCILRGYSGALCAYLQNEWSRGVKPMTPMTPKELGRIVRSSTPIKRIFDHAVLSTQKKANGEKRIILSPGRRIRIAQRLVSDVLESSDEGLSYDYSRRGQGREAAVAEVLRLIREDGIRDFVLFDLKDYFTSVDAKHLRGEPLPWKVFKHSVFYNRSATLLHRKDDAAEAELARHGLPQGARLSGILASSLLGRELRQIAGAMGIVTYVDDGVIGACDPAGAEALAEAIKSRFGNHPGGPLSFKYIKTVSATGGFPFLSYWIRAFIRDGEEVVTARPSHEAKAKFQRGIFRRLRQLGPKPGFEIAAARALEYGRRWRASFSLWQPTPEEQESLEDEVYSYVDDFYSGYHKKLPCKPLPLLPVQLAKSG